MKKWPEKEWRNREPFQLVFFLFWAVYGIALPFNLIYWSKSLSTIMLSLFRGLCPFVFLIASPLMTLPTSLFDDRSVAVRDTFEVIPLGDKDSFFVAVKMNKKTEAQGALVRIVYRQTIQLGGENVNVVRSSVSVVSLFERTAVASDVVPVSKDDVLSFEVQLIRTVSAVRRFNAEGKEQ